MADPGREQHTWRNSPPSPFLSRYSRNPNRNYLLPKRIEPVPANNLPLTDVTSIGYSYGHIHGVTCYTQMLGKNVTLRKLKSVLIIKGNFRNPNRNSPLLKVIDAVTEISLPSEDVTSIGYSYGRHGVTCYTQMLGKSITLRQLKSVLIIKGNFRYFFKTASNDFSTGVVFEEVTEDSKVLPLWEGKVFCVLEPVHE